MADEGATVYELGQRLSDKDMCEWKGHEPAIRICPRCGEQLHYEDTEGTS